MKKRLVSVAVLLCVLISLCVSGCGSGGSGSDITEPTDTTDTEQVKIAEPMSIDDYVKENTTIYEGEDDFSVITMYLTVRTGNTTENSQYSWRDINSHSTIYYQREGIERFRCEGIIQVGDENGPVEGELGYGVTVPNAIVQVRGNTSSVAPQKSYKIKLKDDMGTWRSQKTIALNKHAYDGVRFRNKLSYDLIKTIPEMIGVRTQFVRLYVKDQTEGNMEAAVFEDYGLFTQCEQINKTYLQNHGFDRNGQLYKATSFEFLRYDDVIKMADDPTYDQAAFELLIEIKGNDDHTDLISMLNDVNNYSVSIEEVVRKHFDEDNYLTWLAYQVLTGNTDITSQNFYLYSPASTEKFYFISWDNDGAFRFYHDEIRSGLTEYNYVRGVSNLYGCVLHRRVLQSAELRAKFIEKVEYVRSLITNEKVQELSNKYAEIVRPYLNRNPDAENFSYSIEEFEAFVANMGTEVEKGYNYIMQSLNYPSPFYIDTPRAEGDNTVFVWDTSEDPDGEKIIYHFTLSSSPAMTNPIIDKGGLTIPTVIYGKLPAGMYFIKVTSTNEKGYTQTAMERYDDENDVRYYGVISFNVNADGSITR